MLVSPVICSPQPTSGPCRQYVRGRLVFSHRAKPDAVYKSSISWELQLAMQLVSCPSVLIHAAHPKGQRTHTRHRNCTSSASDCARRFRAPPNRFPNQFLFPPPTGSSETQARGPSQRRVAPWVCCLARARRSKVNAKRSSHSRTTETTAAGEYSQELIEPLKYLFVASNRQQQLQHHNDAARRIPLPANKRA